MRTIKFRGKPCYEGGKQSPWVFGTFQYLLERVIGPGSTNNGTLRQRTDKGIIRDFYGTKTEILCDTLGQFFGLKDKDGHDIYEGDIVKCGSFVYQVVYDGKRFASFALQRKEDTFLHYFGEGMEASECVVIGNIHDNPELI